MRGIIWGLIIVTPFWIAVGCVNHEVHTYKMKSVVKADKVKQFDNVKMIQKGNEVTLEVTE